MSPEAWRRRGGRCPGDARDGPGREVDGHVEPFQAGEPHAADGEVGERALDAHGAAGGLELDERVRGAGVETRVEVGAVGGVCHESWAEPGDVQVEGKSALDTAPAKAHPVQAPVEDEGEDRESIILRRHLALPSTSTVVDTSIERCWRRRGDSGTPNRRCTWGWCSRTRPPARR